MQKHNVYYLAQEKMKYNNYQSRIKKNKRRFFVFSIFLLILLFLFSYRLYKKHHIILYTADYGELVDGFITQALIIRDEQVYYASESGYANFLFSEGKRAAYGQGIVRLNSRILYNYQSGIISFAIDGLEEDLGSSKIDNINTDNFYDYKRKFKQNFDNDYIKKGQALFRIVNNNQMFSAILTDREEAARYRPGEKVFVQADEIGDRLVEASIYKIKLEGEKGLLIIKFDLFLMEWLNARWVEFRFIKNIHRGIVIPRKAVFTSPEGEGVLVYIPFSDTYQFKNIQVLEGNEEMVVVDGISIGENLVINPEDLDYGRGV